MRKKTEPLLCELHAHTTWSDGALSLTELVDLYGRAGFDVLAVTDHVNRTDDPLLPPGTKPRGVMARDHRAYLAAIDAEAERALAAYDLLLLPGLELSVNDLDPFLAAHAVAVGLRTFVGVDDGLEAALAAPAARGRRSQPPIRSDRAAPALRAARRCASPVTGASCRTTSTAGSSSTATTSSAGSPSAACRRWQAAISTGPSICTAGRPCFRARRRPPRSLRISGPRVLRS